MVIMADYLSKSVLKMNVLFCNNRITDEHISIQILMMHIHRADLVVFVSGVVVDSLCGIAAGSIKGNFIFTVSYFAASSLLVHRTQNMKELTDTFGFRFAGSGVHSGKSYSGEAGSGGKISGKSQGAHAAAVGRQVETRCESVFRLAGRQGHVVVELEHLLWKWGIVGEHTHRVVIDVQSVFHGFHCNGAGSICNDPVKLSAGEILIERSVCQVHAG